MRVGVIGPQGADDFADNISDSLDAMAIDNVRLGPAQPRPRNPKVSAALSVARQALWVDERLQRRVATRALEYECDAVLTVEGNTSPAVVETLRANGVPVALWFPDHITNLGRFQMLLAPYSALFFKEPILVQRLRATLDLPVHYLPEACNSRWHRSDEPQGVDPVIVVAGNMYPSRLRLLERLVGAGIPLELYGGGFPRWVGNRPAFGIHTGKYIVRREKADTFRRAAAVLNSLHPGEVDGVNCRLFEATGSGAVVLAEDRAEMDKLFSPDEVLSWATFDDLIDQARRALTGAGTLFEVGDRAAVRAHTEHTYERRLSVIIDRFV
jgi:spore maturation protein CgeB